MKQIICGIEYDTEKAELVTVINEHTDADCWTEVRSVYKTKGVYPEDVDYFVHIVTGSRSSSKFNEQILPYDSMPHALLEHLLKHDPVTAQKEFPDGIIYTKEFADMRRVTKIWDCSDNKGKIYKNYVGEYYMEKNFFEPKPISREEALETISKDLRKMYEKGKYIMQRELPSFSNYDELFS